MYERMLNKQTPPTMEEMIAYCGASGERFTQLNEWLTATYQTEQKITFPYGNQYGWGISHHRKKKLICNVFAENGSFTVMVRLSGKQFNSLYAEVLPYTQEYIDNKYPCGDGGWIHYRVTSPEQLSDIQKMLSIKCGQ